MSKDETMARPDLPKRLAATIRAHRRKVADAMDAIVCGEHSLRQDQARIDEYEADPVAFAAEWYKGLEVDPYPVQTNIARCRENVAHQTDRYPHRVARLKEARKEMEQVEKEILAQVAASKPTPGRVPWPEPLPSFAEFRRPLDEEFEAEMAGASARRREYMENLAKESREEDARLQEEQARQDAILAEESRRQRARMSPLERERHDYVFEAVLLAVKEKRVHVLDAPEYAAQVAAEWTAEKLSQGPKF